MPNPGYDAEKVREAVALVGTHGNVAAASRASGIPYTTLERRFKAAGTVAPVDSNPPDPIEIRDAAFWRRKARAEGRRADELAHVLNEVSGLMHRMPEPPEWVLPAKGKTHTAVGLIHTSDWHAGEVVNGDEIGGLNSYDPDVFRRRIRRMFSAAIEILPRWAADCDLRGVVLAVNGDLISGDIHDELKRTNAITAHEQVYLAADEACAGIRRLRDAFGKVMAVFTSGNHGRTTDKSHAKRNAALSYDAMIGEMVRRHFEGDDAVTVIVAGGPDAVYSLLGWNVLQTHGDAMGSGGGMGFAGPSLPITRGAKKVQWQAALTEQRYNVMLTAHYHTRSNPYGDVYGNGSIVGYNEYANRIRAGFEAPQQWLLLIHEAWCVREQCSLKLENPRPPERPRVRVPATMERA